MVCELTLQQSLVRRRQMAVPISHRNIAVTNHLLHLLQTSTRQNQVRTERVTLIMEMKI
jgi:hypothetical protein